MTSPIRSPSPNQELEPPPLTAMSSPIFQVVQPFFQQELAQASLPPVPPPSGTLLRFDPSFNVFRGLLEPYFNGIEPPALREKVKSSLCKWVLQPQGRIQKLEAAKRLIQCLCARGDRLNLSGLDLPSLPPLLFELSFLRILKLSGRVADHLDPSISKLTSLEELELCESHCTTLPFELSSLPHLRSLSLHSDSLIQIPRVLFSLGSLTYLCVCCPHLKDLGHEWSKLIHLEDLHILDCQPDLIPHELGLLENLTSLSLEKLRLQQFPDCILKLKRLHYLNLSDNLLESLPERICQLEDLSILSLTNNRLHTLPQSIGQLRHLKELLVSRNHLTDLPPTFRHLENLENFEIDSNRLKSIPDSLINLECPLEFLNLSRNQLQELPINFGHLMDVLELDLSHNLISSVDNCQFLFQLTVLNLSHNRLTAIPQIMIDAYHEDQAIIELNLSHNAISQWPRDSIGLLSYVQILNISFNLITYFPPSIADLAEILRLDISGNPLTFLPIEMGALGSLNFLDCSKTPLQELPSSLANCVNLTEIEASQTGISDDMIQAIYDASDALLDAAEADIATQDLLGTHLNLWTTALTRPMDLSSLLAWEESERAILLNWLRRLEITRDFLGQKKPIAEAVCDMLHHCLTSDSFKLAFLSQATVNNESCQDRAAMALNELFVAYKLDTLSELSLTDQYAILKGAAKTISLRKILTQKIHEKTQELDDLSPQDAPHQVLESVEIFLYYEMALSRPLQLLTLTKRMSYMNIGNVPWINLNEVQSLIELQYEDELIDLEGFKALAQQYPFYTILNEGVKADFHHRLEELEALDLKEGELLQQSQALILSKHHAESLNLKKWLNFIPFLIWAEKLPDVPLRQVVCQRFFECFHNGYPVLNLSSLNLTDLPSDIRSLPIRELDLSHNQFLSIPEPLLDLLTLEHLNVADNQIASIPSNIHKLKNLRVLNLSLNPLLNLPSACGKLLKLEQLLLDHTYIQQIPSSFITLYQLEILSCQGTRGLLEAWPHFLSLQDSLKPTGLSFLISRLAIWQQQALSALNLQALAKEMPQSIAALTQFLDLIEDQAPVLGYREHLVEAVFRIIAKIISCPFYKQSFLSKMALQPTQAHLCLQELFLSFHLLEAPTIGQKLQFIKGQCAERALEKAFWSLWSKQGSALNRGMPENELLHLKCHLKKTLNIFSAFEPRGPLALPFFHITATESVLACALTFLDDLFIDHPDTLNVALEDSVFENNFKNLLVQEPQEPSPEDKKRALIRAFLQERGFV